MCIPCACFKCILNQSCNLQELHRYIAKHAAAPEAAQLFFIPVYSGHYYHSLLVTRQLSHQDSIIATAQLVADTIAWVRMTHAHWNISNGADHFLVCPMDHGRCHSMAGLSNDTFGDMFVVQQNGDVALKDFETQSWRCYQPGRDLLMPTLTEEYMRLTDVVRPEANARPISVLYRFAEGGRGDYGSLRTSLLQAHEQNPIPNASAGWATASQTHRDMSQAIFCVCPPGISQHTLRMYCSIMFGCIPITFLTGNDLPYERITGIQYSKFSININPWESHLLRPVLSSLLSAPAKIVQMQNALSLVQDMFVWAEADHSGVYATLYRELQQHPMRRFTAAWRKAAH